MRFARVDENGKCIIVEEFSSLYDLHESLRGLFIEADETVSIGHYYLSGSWVGPKPSEFHFFSGGSWVEDTSLRDATLTQRQIDGARTTLKSNREFGQKLADDFAIENVVLGINAAGSDIVLGIMSGVLEALSKGYLETAIYRVKAMDAGDRTGTFLNEERLLRYVNMIEEKLGLPLSTDF